MEQITPRPKFKCGILFTEEEMIELKGYFDGYLMHDIRQAQNWHLLSAAEKINAWHPHVEKNDEPNKEGLSTDGYVV